MRGEDGRLAPDSIARLAQATQDAEPSGSLARTGEVADVLEHHNRRPLGVQDRQDVLERVPRSSAMPS